MAYEVVVPRLGLTMEQGVITQWYKQDGEFIQAGEPLFALETDKTIIDIEAPFSGKFHRVPDLPSTALPIGHLIGYILVPGEELQEHPVAASTPVPPVTVAAAISSPVSIPSPQRKLSSPAARRRAHELGIDWSAIEPRTGGPILVEDVEQFARQTSLPAKVIASPVARRLAKDLGVDLHVLAAQKPGEKIFRADVEAFAALAPEENIPNSQVRRLTAQRMAESAHTTAPVTLTTEADVTELVDLRERLKSELLSRNQLVPTYTDLLIKLTCLALQEYPDLNAFYQDNTIVRQVSVHIGLAVDTEAGLFVPVIRDAAPKSIQQIAMARAALVEKARARKLEPDELQGGTFTITNLGNYGIDAFTPIINLPQIAILGIGRIQKKPGVYNDQVIPRAMMALSLTFDHRAVDGGPAAKFLNKIREFSERPYCWLIC